MASPGAHLLLASKLRKRDLDRERFFIGNLLPDVEHFMRPKKELKVARHFGSEHWDRKKLLEGFNGDKSLREGIKMHFLVDDYVHYNYVLPKIKKFREKGNPKLIHYLTEQIMDRVLGKKSKRLVRLYDELMKKVDVVKYGGHLDKMFPKSKHKGEILLREGLEILRIKNYTSIWRMNKIKGLIKKHNPFKEAEPSNLRLFYLIFLLEREIRKDIKDFLKKAEKELRGRV